MSIKSIIEFVIQSIVYNIYFKGGFIVMNNFVITCCSTVDLEKEYGIEHLVDSLEGDFYTFDMFYQSQEHYQTMVEIFKEDLIINDHGGIGSCDCSTIEFDKGSAIAYLLDYFHIDKDNAYAFGDGYNDQAMFREVGHGIAMGNAVDVLKEKATYITDNFDQEGILKALYHEKVLNEKDNY